MRIFVGVFPPLDVLRKLEAALADIPTGERGVRWTTTDQRHVTLFFLGEIPDDRVDELKRRLARAAQNVPPFVATLKGLDGFPNLQSPKTLFVSSDSEASGWRRLTEALRPELDFLGFKIERDGFRPHLTLARLKDPGAARALLPVLGRALEMFEASWDVDVFRLVSSRLEPQGARYATLETFQLKKVE